MSESKDNQERGSAAPAGITRISVRNFKSIADEQSIEVRPLTILAGANSSGKSSIMQPLLLLKQTLDATYDPGPLKLTGANVRFTSLEQFLRTPGEEFSVGLELAGGEGTTNVYGRDEKGRLELREMRVREPDGAEIVLKPGMSHADIVRSLSGFERDPLVASILGELEGERGCQLEVDRKQLSLWLTARHADTSNGTPSLPFATFWLTSWSESHIRQVIHLPGLRGNPERRYPIAAVRDAFPGTFEHYAASVVWRWQEDGDARHKQLGEAFKTLGLTWKVQARRVDDTQVEVSVGRLPRAVRAGAHDLVSIADVGFGVSQVFPVVVALLAAQPGQLVYLEQPELHLHPRAQVALAQLLADAAERGVRVVAETHSEMLLLGVQTLVAQGRTPRENVILHWFTRDPHEGVTEVASAELDEAGAFGDWPEDFSDVELKAHKEYLDHAELHLGL